MAARGRNRHWIIQISDIIPAVDLHQLRCFVAVAEELHFGRAARRLDMLPSALSRAIRLLETSLGAPLLLRTTRNVMLSHDGAAFVDDARGLLARADALAAEVRERGRRRSRSLIRVGAIDTAAAGLVPALLHDFRELRAAAAVQLVEDKTVRLVPKLLSGRLDIAFIRPPERLDKRIETMMLFHETPVVAVPSRHRLAGRRRLSIEALADEPMIVPDRSARPHSHDLTIKLFERGRPSPQAGAECRGEADHRTPRRRRPGRGDRAAVGGTPGCHGRPLRAARLPRRARPRPPADGSRLAAQRTRPRCATKSSTCSACTCRATRRGL